MGMVFLKIKSCITEENTDVIILCLYVVLKTNRGWGAHFLHIFPLNSVNFSTRRAVLAGLEFSELRV